MKKETTSLTNAIYHLNAAYTMILGLSEDLPDLKKIIPNIESALALVEDL
jgi:hypothetical protein